MEYDYLFKLIIVGDCGVGKSSLLLQYSDGSFSDTYLSTIGVDFKIKTIYLNDKIIKLQIWDTAGQERFKSIIASYYRGAHGLLLVYDVTSERSFNNLQSWLDEIKINMKDREICKILIGNKCENSKSRAISLNDAADFALQNNLKYLETSAKTAENVNMVFEHIVNELMISAAIKLKKTFEMEIDTKINNAVLINKKKSCCS